MADKNMPVDAHDGYSPSALGPTAPQHDPAVRAAARADAEGQQAKEGARWDTARLDRFVNFLTGLGDQNQDKTLGGLTGALTFVVTYLSGAQCEDWWRGSDLGGRVVEQVPAEMTRRGFELAVQPDSDEPIGDDESALDRALSRRIDSMRGQVSETVWAEWARSVRRLLVRRRRDLAPAMSPAPGAPPSTQAPPLPLPDVDEEAQRIVDEIEDQHRDLNTIDAFREALEYERAYGGAAILLGVADGVTYDLTVPLDLDKVERVTHLTVFRGGWDGEVIAWRYYNDPRKPKFGMPEVYMLRNLGVPVSAPPAPGEKPDTPQIMPVGPAGALTFYVHESRLLVFGGKAVSRRARVQMRGWGDTVFMRVAEVLQQYNQTWQAIANIMVEWSMGVLKMDGLAELFAAAGDPMSLPSGGTGPAPTTGGDLILERVRAMNLSKSVVRTVLIDGKEDYTRETSPLTGLAEVLSAFMLRLASAVDQPVSLLMGQSPGGLRAGDDDVRFFYDRIMARIGGSMTSNWRTLTRLLFRARKTSPTNGREPRKWHITPLPLRQMSEKEIAEVRKLTAETDAIYLDRSVVSAAEVTASRYGGAKWSAETTVDFALREAASKRAELAAKRRAMGPPPPSSPTSTLPPPAGPPAPAARGQLGAFDPPAGSTQTADPTPKPGTVAPQGGAGSLPSAPATPRPRQAQPGAVGSGEPER